MNKVMLSGRICRIRPLNNGTAFGVAVYDKRAENNTEFIDCIAFGNSSKFFQKHFSVGRAVEIEGHISKSSYDKNGNIVYNTSVIVDDIGFVKSDRREQIPELIDINAPDIPPGFIQDADAS